MAEACEPGSRGLLPVAVWRCFGPLRSQAGRARPLVGSALAAQAIRAGLGDECHLFVAPIVVGGGHPSLPNNVRLELELVDERRFGNGMVHLHYRTRT